MLGYIETICKVCLPFVILWKANAPTGQCQLIWNAIKTASTWRRQIWKMASCLEKQSIIAQKRRECENCSNLPLCLSLCWKPPWWNRSQKSSATSANHDLSGTIHQFFFMVNNYLAKAPGKARLENWNKGFIMADMRKLGNMHLEFSEQMDSWFKVRPSSQRCKNLGSGLIVNVNVMLRKRQWRNCTRSGGLTVMRHRVIVTPEGRITSLSQNHRYLRSHYAERTIEIWPNIGKYVTAVTAKKLRNP